MSIQNTNQRPPNLLLGLDAQNDLVAASAPARQQFVLIDPQNPSSLGTRGCCHTMIE